MIRINLLPIRQIKKRQRNRQEIFVFFISLILIAVAISTYGLILVHKIEDLNAQVSSLKKKKDSYLPTIKLIEDLKKEKKILQAKLDTIKTLKKNSQITVRILDELARKTPSNRLWLTSLSQANDKLKLSGVALDNATIAQYMNDLTKSNIFIDAELANSSQTAVAGRKLKSFSLSLTIRMSTPEEGTAEKNKGAKG